MVFAIPLHCEAEAVPVTARGAVAAVTSVEAVVVQPVTLFVAVTV